MNTTRTKKKRYFPMMRAKANTDKCHRKLFPFLTSTFKNGQGRRLCTLKGSLSKQSNAGVGIGMKRGSSKIDLKSQLFRRKGD